MLFLTIDNCENKITSVLSVRIYLSFNSFNLTVTMGNVLAKIQSDPKPKRDSGNQTKSNKPLYRILMNERTLTGSPDIF